MKIAFFTDAFYPSINGITTYISVVVKNLVAKGHLVMIVAPKWNNVSLELVEKFIPNVKIVLVPGTSPIFYPNIRIGTPTPKSINEIRKFSPDIIHFHTPAFIGFEAIALAKLFKKPLINTFHTYYMEPEGFTAMGLKENSAISKILQDSLWKISEKIHSSCDVVVAPTNYVGKDLKNHWPNVNVQVIPGAVDLKSFDNHSKRKLLRNKYKLNQSIVFLSVGRLSSEKHYEVLITAFSMLLMKHPSSRLVFIGDGPAQKELEYIAKILGIEHAIIFTGKIPYEKISGQNYYSMGDVFVSPSTWDTQGLSIVEAMASGLPVVAFNYRAMPEVIGKGGILVKLSDQFAFAKAMGKLAGDLKLRNNLGKLALLQSQKYQIDTHTDNLIKLYQSQIDSKKNPNSF